MAKTAEEKLQALVLTISRMHCPDRYDKCKEPEGCFGGARRCTLHNLLDTEMLVIRDNMLNRAETRNLKHLRKENAALRSRLDKILTLSQEPLPKEEDSEG